MDSKLLKELIESIFEDYELADFDLHFVDKIKINKEFKHFEITGSVTNEQIEQLLLYGINVREEMIRNMISEFLVKVLMDSCKENSQDRWSLTEPVKIELYITNWELKEEITKNDMKHNYRLTLEFAQ
jgi:hypothetical protein